MIITLSLGLVSVNLPLSSYAQNNALSQSGDDGDEAEQSTEQSQSFNQNGQSISGESGVLSGNNFECLTQDDSYSESNTEGICVLEEITNPLPTIGQNILTVSVQVCGQKELSPSFVIITVTDEVDGSSSVMKASYKCVAISPFINNFVIPTGHPFNVKVDLTGTFPQTKVDIFGNCDQTSNLSCRGVMGIFPIKIDILIDSRIRN